MDLYHLSGFVKDVGSIGRLYQNVYNLHCVQPVRSQRHASLSHCHPFAPMCHCPPAGLLTQVIRVRQLRDQHKLCSRPVPGSLTSWHLPLVPITTAMTNCWITVCPSSRLSETKIQPSAHSRGQRRRCEGHNGSTIWVVRAMCWTPSSDYNGLIDVGITLVTTALHPQRLLFFVFLRLPTQVFDLLLPQSVLSFASSKPHQRTLVNADPFMRYPSRPC